MNKPEQKFHQAYQLITQYQQLGQQGMQLDTNPGLYVKQLYQKIENAYQFYQQKNYGQTFAKITELLKGKVQVPIYYQQQNDVHDQFSQQHSTYKPRLGEAQQQHAQALNLQEPHKTLSWDLLGWYDHQKQNCKWIYDYNNQAQTIIQMKASLYDYSQINVNVQPRTKATEEYKELEVAFKLNRMINFLIQSSDIHFKIMSCVKTACAYPFACVEMMYHHDLNENTALLINNHQKQQLKEVKLQIIPAETFYWDPSAYQIEQCNYCFYEINYNVFDFINFLSTPAVTRPAVSQLPTGTTFDYAQLDQAILDLYLNTTDSFHTWKFPWAKSVRNQHYQQHQIKHLLTNQLIPIQVLFLKQYDHHGNPVKCKKFYLFQQIVLGYEELPVYQIPIAVLKEAEIPQSFLGSSSVMRATPLIEKISLLNNRFQKSLLSSMTDKWIVARDAIAPKQQEFEQFLASPYQTYFEVNNSNVAEVMNNIANVAPNQVSQSDINLLQFYKQELFSSIGSSELNQGDFGSAINKGAVQSMISQVSKRENESILELKKFIQRIVVLSLNFLLEHYYQTVAKANKQISVLDHEQVSIGVPVYEDYQTKMIGLTEDELLDLNYFVDVNVDLIAISKKEKALNDLMQLLTLSANTQDSNIAVSLEDILPLLDIPNKADILFKYRNHKESMRVEDITLTLQLFLQQLQQMEGQDPSQIDIGSMFLNIYKQVLSKQLDGNDHSLAEAHAESAPDFAEFNPENQPL